MKSQPAMEQLPEIIYIDGVLHTLYTTPLSPWLRKLSSSSVFDRQTPTCERGYIGKWQIKDDTLWLTGLYGWRNGEDTGVSELFGDELKEVAADWFSGPLVVEPASSSIADGAYPKVSTLFVEAGRIIQT
jgi:hypothetical protein